MPYVIDRKRVNQLDRRYKLVDGDGMKQFGAFEAKTHFSELLSGVMMGEQFVITKHGNKVALMIPFADVQQETDPKKDAIRAIRKLRKGITLGKKLSIRKMREEGRR